ncbi:MAG: hypothetical protein Q9183_003751, partial [Haloplaca sp. 2 TL-2023]
IDDGVIEAFFELYAGYIKKEKESASEVYNISKLERHNKTLPRASVDDRKPNVNEAVTVQNHESSDFSSALVPHETVARKWSVQAGLRSKIPRRLLAHAMFESVVVPDCRLVFGAELGAMDVKGDNEKTVDQTIQRLERLEQAITLRYTLPLVYNAQTVQSAGLEFRLAPLGSRQTLRQTSTTMLSSNSPVSSEPSSLGIVVMIARDSGDTTAPSIMPNLMNGRLADLPAKNNVWRGPSIGTYGPHQRSPSNPEYGSESNPPRASTTVAEWIESVPLHISDSLRPLNETNETNETAESDPVTLDTRKSTESNTVTPFKKQYARVRKVPGMQSIPKASKSELDSPSHNLEHISPTDQASQMMQDLLTGEEEPSVDQPLDTVLSPRSISVLTAIPNLTPTPAVPISNPLPTAILRPVRDEQRSSHASTKPARSLRASTAFTSQTHSEEQQQAVWMSRNPQGQAREAKKGVSLIDDVEVKPKMLSYAAMAKRNGTSTDQHHDRLHKNAEVQTRQIHRTMNQKTPKPTDESALLQTSYAAMSQILEGARAYRGILQVEVDIGRILVQLSSVPARIAAGYTFSMNEWSNLFGTPAGSTETLFTNRLPALENEMQHITELKHPNGQRIFGKDPSIYSVRYRFLCGSRSGDEDVILEAPSDGTVQALSNDHLVGAIQWHLGLWDARMAVKATEQIDDYKDAIATISDSLSIIPDMKKDTVTLSAELGTSSLYFKSAHVLRDITFVCQTDPDLAMVCTRVQSLGPVEDRTRFTSSKTDSLTMKNDGNIWWEVRLRSIKTTRLEENQKLPLGELASWEPSDVIGRDVLRRLHALSVDVVSQMDDIGMAAAKDGE